ncbi:MAG: ribosome silencing factor, partial [Planctomycetes bacterium]|nr:ribosome silencing factor [Planctomycetota bacterium]
IEVGKLLDERRAENISVIDVRKLLPITSYFVVATGSSSRAIRMLGDAAENLLRGSSFQKLGVETDDEGRWVCIDYSEVVVHLFEPEAREFYDLERLWSDAPRVPVPRPSTPTGSRSTDDPDGSAPSGSPDHGSE